MILEPNLKETSPCFLESLRKSRPAGEDFLEHQSASLSEIHISSFLYAAGWLGCRKSGRTFPMHFLPASNPSFDSLHP